MEIDQHYSQNETEKALSCKTERLKFNDDNEEDNSSRFKLVECKTQNELSIVIDKDTTTYDNDNGCSTQLMGSTLKREQEMIAMAHGTWNKRQAKLTSYNREIKATTQGLRSFAKVLKNSQVQSIATRSDNSIEIFDIKKWRAAKSLKNVIKQLRQTTEKLGIQIQITLLLRVKSKIADALS
ncbi:MAG: hypothetical protein EZS28_005689 [Streblomastix strix]|uniref:Uncharacterized protein n=1 Tax=Streblomastix strix TaxID=222440 RepID=A0A5J4WUQ9_9EUKA|nr:MAG: hypothetical protein EZS28_005689 [Streblomastix strix]